MTQFHTPQYIDIEDKIFGPFTLKQFIYIVGAAGAAFLFWTIFSSKIIAIIFIVPISGIGLLLAFYKVNNRPFIRVLESAFKYFVSGKLFLWRKEKKKTTGLVETELAENSKIAVSKIPKINEGKLGDLSWKVDVAGGQTPRPIKNN